MFPIVGIDRGFHGNEAGTHPTKNTSESSPLKNQCLAGSQDPVCLSLAAAATAAATLGQPKHEGRRGGGGETPAGGFPLTGFLRVELVALPGAEVTFRPGEVRGAVLEKERAELAAVEKKVHRSGRS